MAAGAPHRGVEVTTQRGRAFVRTVLLLAVLVPTLLCASIWVLLQCRALLQAWPCDTTVHRRVDSPDGAWQAVIFDTDCGATTAFNMQVSILPSRDATPSGPGNALVIDRGRDPAVSLDVEARWTGPREIRVTRDARAWVFHQVDHLGDVTLHQRTREPAPP
jgi:hypothetical protein